MSEENLSSSTPTSSEEEEDPILEAKRIQLANDTSVVRNFLINIYSHGPPL